MEKPPFLDPTERVVALNDIARFFKRQKKRLIRIGFVGALCAFLICAIRAPKYKIEATFKEGVEKSGTEGVLKDLLGGMSVGPQQPQAVALMKSYQVLKPLVEKLGLQASVPKSGWMIQKALRRIGENISADRGKKLTDIDSFSFQNVTYEGETNQSLILRFDDPTYFSVYDPSRKVLLAKGTLGSEVVLPDARFTLVKTAADFKARKEYPLKLVPWIPVAKALRSQLQIVNHKTNKSIYDLAFFSRDRHLGVEILNGLMFEYQNYLKRDHDQLAKEQLAYLEEKQNHVYGSLSSLFDEHVHYLRNNIANNGFFELNQEASSFLVPYQKMLTKIFEIDLDLESLNQLEKEDVSLPLSVNNFFAKSLVEIFDKIQTLKQKRDLLEISFQKPEYLQKGDLQFEARRDKIKEMRSQRNSLEKMLEEMDRGLPISSFGLNQGLDLWVHQIQRSEEGEEGEDLAEYLENYIRLLSLREKTLQERFFWGIDTPSELNGIDLTTAEKLFIEYNSKLDQAEGSIRHYSQVKEEILRKDFELASLSSLLRDPLSQELIVTANKLALQLKNEKYYSVKEGGRWQDELDLQRKILSDHVQQLIQVEELNASLFREKMAGLRQVSLDCINQQISVLRETAKDSIREQRQSLIQEKKLLEKKMQDIRDLALEMPEKWRSEKWLKLKSEMGYKIMETLTQLVESKTISHHLHHVESKPLDYATLPLFPQPPRLFLMTFAGAFLAAFGTFFIRLLRQILKGFPSSLEKLQAMRFPLLGPISSFCDGPSFEFVEGPDLELLRQLTLFLQKKEGKVVGLIGGRGPDYSYALGENLARMSVRSIVLRCDFGAPFRDDELPGILQIWKGEVSQLPIRKRKGFDFLTAGGYTPYGAEVIQSREFKQLVEQLKEKYDFVFLLTRTPLSYAESMATLRVCDQAVVTVCGEQTELLTPFTDWAYHEGQCRLTFVASDIS